MRIKETDLDNQKRANDSMRELAWKHLIGGANKDECIHIIGLLHQKWEYLNTIEPMLKGKWVSGN